MQINIAKDSLTQGKWLFRRAWRAAEEAVRAEYRSRNVPNADNFPALYLTGFTEQGYLLAHAFPNAALPPVMREHSPSMIELVDDLSADDWMVCDPV